MGRKSKFSASFKAQVALEAVKEQSSVAEIAKHFEVSPSKVTEWKSELLGNATRAFEPAVSKTEMKKLEGKNEWLLKKVGQLTIDCDFFAKACAAAKIKKDS